MRQIYDDPYGNIENFRWKLTDDEKERRIKNCPKCGSENLDPAGGWNSANGWVKCYDCGHGPFWWLRPSTSSRRSKESTP